MAKSSIRPARFCVACDAPIPKFHSKFCSKDCQAVKLISRVWPKNCIICKMPFIARNPNHGTCGAACAARRRSESYRWKNHKRRTALRETDITFEQERELYRRTRKCPLCGVFMTGKAFRPNSKELDHIVPRCMGGTHTHGNVRIICRACNLKRPKDGSDYTGMVTLWATAPGVLVKSRPQPKVSTKPSAPVRICACGNEFRHKTASRCRGCIVKLGQDAAALRLAGTIWGDIADKLGYWNTANLHTYAVKYGGYEPRKYRRAAA